MKIYFENGLLKTSSSQDDFEKSFFQLAYDKLQNKLKNLQPYLVGFELVNKSDDNNKAIGVFGFKSDNGQIMYVPAFFVNGKVKELDTLYSRNNNQFYPLNEDFADLFLKDDVTGLGRVSNGTKQDVQRDSPPLNFRSLVTPPRTAKHASVLEYIKQSDNDVKARVWGLMNKQAGLVEALQRFYSNEEIADALIPKQAEVVEVPEPELQVLRFNDEIKTKLSEEQTNKLTTNGYLILDKRAEDNKSKYGLVKYTESFCNPQESGFYNYITETGSLHNGLVLMHPMQLHQGFSTDEVIVIDLDSKNSGHCYTTNHKNVFVKNQVKLKDLSTVLSKLEDLSEALPSFSNTYILVNENLKFSQPFCITQNYKDGSGIRRIEIEPELHVNRCADRKGSNHFEPLEVPSKLTLIPTKKTGDKLEHRNRAVYVPKGFKLMKVVFREPYEGYHGAITEDERKAKREEYVADRQRYRQGKPGGISSLSGALAEQAIFPFSTHTNGSEYFVSISGVKKKYSNPVEAKIAFVTDLRLDEKESNELIDSLVPDLKKEGYIKLAVTGDELVSLMDEAPQNNELGQPTYYGVPWEQTVTNQESYTDDPTAMGRGTMGEIQGLESGIDGHVNNSSQLAQRGQKEIFDTQAIATLAKYVDPSNKVTSYLPNFVSTLDKLGRMLFMIYWETDKFQQMYGRDELPELIELVKDVFKNLGDLVIFLKRKYPDLSINSNEQAMDQV